MAKMSSLECDLLKLHKLINERKFTEAEKLAKNLEKIVENSSLRNHLRDLTNTLHELNKRQNFNQMLKLRAFFLSYTILNLYYSLQAEQVS